MTFTERQVRAGIRRAFRQMHLPLTRAMLRWLLREIAAEPPAVHSETHDMKTRWVRSRTFNRLFEMTGFTTDANGYRYPQANPAVRYVVHDKMPEFEVLDFHSARQFADIEAPEDLR